MDPEIQERDHTDSLTGCCSLQWYVWQNQSDLIFLSRGLDCSARWMNGAHRAPKCQSTFFPGLKSWPFQFSGCVGTSYNTYQQPHLSFWLETGLCFCALSNWACNLLQSRVSVWLVSWQSPDWLGISALSGWLMSWPESLYSLVCHLLFCSRILVNILRKEH